MILLAFRTMVSRIVALASLIQGEFCIDKFIPVSLPASFIVWLASSEASFLKGKFLWANWDVYELKAKAEKIRDTTYLSVGLVGWPFESGDWKLKTAEGAWDSL